MTVESFLRAFRRFRSRLGVYNTVYSDNAKTFRRAARELAELINHRDALITIPLQELRIQWKFIPDRSPWWGGFWDRMIRSVNQR